jgi:hypothetical protein
VSYRGGSAAILALACILAVGARGLGAQAEPVQAPPADLRSILDEGWILQDRNDDGHPDFVHVRLVVPEGATEAEVAAAANVAARLGLESYGTDLGLLVRDGDRSQAAVIRDAVVPVVAFGMVPELLRAAGVDADRVLRELAPGEGALHRLAPSDALPGGGVWVTGGDATGLDEAGRYLSARLPQLWDPSGPTYSELTEGIEEYLQEAEVQVSGLVLERAVVSGARPGVLRVRVEVEVPTEEDRLRAGEALRIPPEEPEDRPDPRSLVLPGLHRLDLHLVGPDGVEEVHRIRPERAWSEPAPAGWNVRDVPDLSLTELFSTDGLFRDTRQDLVPDRSDVFLSLAGAQAAGAAVDLAQRVGLETAGLRLPLVRIGGQDDDPQELGVPILFGVDHHVTGRLEEEGRLALATREAGSGFVEFVREALGDRHALVVGGGDEAGLEAAGRVVAHRLPFLHEPPAGRRAEGYELWRVEEEVRRFVQARSSAGQVALALHKLEQWLDRLDEGDRPGAAPSDAAWPVPFSGQESPGLSALRVELAVDTVPPGLEGWIARRLSERMPGVVLALELHSVGFGQGEVVREWEMAMDWEVEEARAVLREEVYPRVDAEAAGADVVVQLRVSEPPEVREALAGEIRDSLEARGLEPDQLQVEVLNAYKQGYSWLQDRVLTRIREEGLGGPPAGEPAPTRIEIDYRHLQDSDEVPWQVVGSPTRWLQELFPVDAVLARELGIADSLVVFRPVHDGGPVYRVRVYGAAEEPLLEDAFDPTYVIRPYFHLYPDYERVRITTGWIRVGAGGEELVDRRIRTDLERFWDRWQDEVLPGLRDYVMDIHDGEVTPGNAPFFDELDIRVRLSEPDHRIGIDEEVISSLESVHNDLYFHSLAFFGHLGQHYGVGSLNFPGRILPWIDPTGSGEAGEARVTLSGKARAAPELVLHAISEDGHRGRWRYALSPLPTEDPTIRGVGVGAGQEALGSLLVDVVAADSLDRWDEHRGRAGEGAVDRTLLSVELLQGMVDRVRTLHGEGILEHALAFRGVDELALRFLVEDDDEFQRIVRLSSSSNPAPTEHPRLRADGWEHRGERMVQWANPMAPAEADSIMARLGTFPEATVHFKERSLLGHPIFAVDLRPPTEAAFVSQAKLNALRPTLFLSGRQHANEVSSTSHILRLGELLVTDPEYRALLRNVNIVLHPVANPDGAQLAWEMQQVNPDFTLHAGYLGALGVDMTAGAGSDDPIYPESQVRPRLMERWLPDAYLNLHGYPSHEWVQHFSGYAAWVRGRTVTSRTWWAPRGWFIPGFSWVDDPDHPEIRKAQFAILDTLAAAVTGVPEVQEMSRRQYARYAKYGRQDVDGFQEHFHEGMLVYMALRGRPATGSGPGNPRINYFSATTEAPDETARGAWLELVATAGLAHTSALARYLAGGENRIEREAEAFDGWVARQMYRIRPVLPPSEADGSEEGGG